MPTQERSETWEQESTAIAELDTSKERALFEKKTCKEPTSYYTVWPLSAHVLLAHARAVPGFYPAIGDPGYVHADQSPDTDIKPKARYSAPWVRGAPVQELGCSTISISLVAGDRSS